MIWKLERCPARQLLEHMAAEHWQLTALPEVERQAGGKPWFPTHPQLHFNLSHSGDLSLCTLSDRLVGADVERVRPRREGLPAYVCSPAELDWFCRRGSRWEDFYILWTMKEARVKCTGEGLRQPAREIAVPLPQGETRLEAEGFRYTLLSGRDWRGAVCEKL